MTIADQLRAEGMERGMQQGVQKEKMLIARKLLAHGADVKTISNITGLDISEIEKLEV